MDGKPVVFKSEDSSGTPFFKSKLNLKFLGIFAVVLLLVTGVGAGVYLTGSPLQLRPQAETPEQTPRPSFSPLQIINNRPSASSESAQPISTGSSTPISTGSALLATPTASASAEPNIYDFNSDSKVNTLDLSFMYVNWGTPKPEAGTKADLNKDGVVNGVDYAMLLKQFNQ